MIGPWQLMIMIILPVLLIVGLIMLFVSRAKNKTKAEMLEKQLQDMKNKEKSE